MSVRRIDPRFLLPKPPRSAVVLGDLDPWREGLRHVGVDVHEDARRDVPELVIAPARLSRAALALDAEMVIIEGRSSRPHCHARRARRYLVRPRIDEPTLLLPLESPVPAVYAIDNWSVVDRRWQEVRRRIASALAARSAFPPIPSVVTVHTRLPGLPYLIARSHSCGVVPADSAYVLTLGQGDALSRNVFHVFPKGATEPKWVIKFARVPGYREPFDRDAHGLALASEAGGTVAAHAPSLLGRFEQDGLHASVETAGTGKRLRERLREPGSRKDKLRLIERVAEWVIELGRQTRAQDSTLADERRRLVEEVVPRWAALGAQADMARLLPPLPAVLQHNDLGSWNIVVNETTFTVLDWESARRHGLPLWDLFYFLADALAVVDGSISGGERRRHTLPLFRGELPSSSILFAWTRRAVSACDVPPDAVGAIATMCWLHHSLSHVARGAVLDRFANVLESPTHGTEQIGALWLADPVLGAGWSRWQVT